MNPIIILGSGLAGYNVAKELRKLNKEAPLTVVTADSGSFYSKPMLSNALAGKKPPSAIALSSPEQMATQLNATVRAQTRVTAIHPASRSIHIGAEVLSYSRLVLALGADQIRLPIAGNAADTIITVNDLDEYARFHTLLNAQDGKKRVVIIGAGLIGSEFANDLVVGGHHAEVIDIASQPLGRLLPPQGGDRVREKLKALGVVWHLGTSAKSVSRDGPALKVTLDNDTTIHADIVLSAVGLKPRTALAQTAGLNVNRGIVVNRYLQTSDADIYAIGDCMEIDNLVMPYVMPIMHAARALGATLSGNATRVSFPAMPVMVKTPACPTIVSPPAPGAVGEWQVSATPEGITSRFVDASGALLGFALNGAATAERGKLASQLPPVLA